MRVIRAGGQRVETATASPWRMPGRGVGRVAFGVVMGVAGAAVLSGCAAGIAPREPAAVHFDGARLLALSDADMVATAYASGRLDRAEETVDTLEVMDLPYDGGAVRAHRVAASNSVISGPPVMDTDPQGRVVYVAETRGPAPAAVTQYDDVFADFPEGSRIRVVALGDDRLTVLEDVEVGTRPLALAVSPDGGYLAVSTLDGVSVWALEADGRVGQRAAHVPAATLLAGAVGGDKDAVSALAWHPDGSLLVANVSDVMLRALRWQPPAAGAPARLELHGEPVTGAGSHMAAGRFTPDGRFFLVPDLKWDQGFLFNPPGEVIRVAFDPSDAADHRVVSRTRVGVGPEGLDISPDGRLAATVNMQRTYLPGWLFFWPGYAHSTVSLITIDSDTGQLDTVGEYGFEGLLPEMLQFDADGDTLAIGVYHDREPTPRTGRIEFWNVLPGPPPRLQRTDHDVPIIRGLHDLLLVDHPPTPVARR